MKKKVIEQLATLITAAFGFVAALAWNEAIKEMFTEIFGERTGLAPMFSYAVAVTVIAVLVTVWIGRVSHGSGKD